MQGIPQKTKILREEEGMVSKNPYNEIPAIPKPNPAMILPMIVRL